MSIYDKRDTPAYRPIADPYRNKSIERWWTSEHDLAIQELITKHRWYWYWEVSDTIRPLIPDSEAQILCSQRAWYNKVMKFAITRADETGFTKPLPLPKRKLCPLCDQPFVEDSLPFALVKRLGIDNLDFCAPCLKETVLQNSGSETATKKQVLEFMRSFAESLQRVPPQGFGEGIEDFAELPSEQRVSVLRALKTKPSTKRVKQLCGSWLQALIESGVLASGTRETLRGTQTLALDGHVCRSLGEKTIDDYLSRKRIPHEREPKYPDSNYRADFLVGEIFIEYFGLAGDPDYDRKTKEKQRMCKQAKIELIALYPKDLIAISTLNRKLQALNKHSDSCP